MPVPRKVWLQTFGGDAGRLCAPPHHGPSVGVVEPLAVELRQAAAVWSILDGLEQGPVSANRARTTYSVRSLRFRHVINGSLAFDLPADT